MKQLVTLNAADLPADDIARAAALSGLAAYITGVSFAVDGGLTCRIAH
jgi:hypothetical protein